MVSQAASKLFAVPPRVAVAAVATDTWQIDFAAALKTGEAITDVGATMVQLSPTTGLAEEDASAFVVAVSLDASTITAVNVGWSAAALTEGNLYRLDVTASLNSGATLPCLIHVECVG